MIIDLISKNPMFSVLPGPKHNKKDQEIHYWIVYHGSKQVYEYHTSYYNEKEPIAKLKRWYKQICKTYTLNNS